MELEGLRSKTDHRIKRNSVVPLTPVKTSQKEKWPPYRAASFQSHQAPRRGGSEIYGTATGTRHFIQPAQSGVLHIYNDHTDGD